MIFYEKNVKKFFKYLILKMIPVIFMIIFIINSVFVIMASKYSSISIEKKIGEFTFSEVHLSLGVILLV